MKITELLSLEAGVMDIRLLWIWLLFLFTNSQHQELRTCSQLLSFDVNYCICLYYNFCKI
ncbi:hypothetical protein JHK86_013023 [Glycine max]|nr:hypothetical protein JHK86_013023 [Glycine max]